MWSHSVDRKGTNSNPQKKAYQEFVEVALVGGHHLACACIAGIFILFHKAPASSSSVADWVTQQDFDPVIPFRSDFTPGTLLRVGKYRDRVAMESGAFLDGNTQMVLRAKLPNVALNLKLNANITAETSGSKFTGTEDLKAVLELSDLELLTLPLDRVRDRVKGNARIESALANLLSSKPFGLGRCV
jgi:hypothetical protein